MYMKFLFIVEFYHTTVRNYSILIKEKELIFKACGVSKTLIIKFYLEVSIMEGNQPFIQVKNVSKTYKDGDILNKVLDNISFNVNEKELVAVVGDSGSGKTTLMNLLGGLDKTDSGKIIIDNKEVSNMKANQRTLYRRNNIGFIFQDYNLIQVLNVYENIMLPLQLSHKEVDENKIDMLLNSLNLKDKKYVLPSKLSGGEQQRVAIIRALINEPKLILADEPTGNLDSKNSALVVNLIKVLCKKMSRTVILVTHNIQIAKLCDRIICVKDGKVIEGDKNEKK